MQLTNEVDRRQVIALVQHPSRVWAAHDSGRVRQKHDRCVAKRRKLEAADEFNRRLLQRDDEVEPDSSVLHLQKIAKPLSVGALREPRDIDELGVIVEVSFEALVEDPGQLALADD